MIGVEQLLEIIRLSLYTGYIEGENPISVMFISDRPESGKSEALKLFSDNARIAYLTDATAYAIWRDLHRQIEQGSLRFLLFPEFLTPISRSRDTVASFLSTLGSLTSEGIAEIHTGFLRPIKLESPKAIGVIACLPRPAYVKRRDKWEESGFLSRFLVVSYSYAKPAVEGIMRSIAEREYLGNSPIMVNLPEEDTGVTIPSELSIKGTELGRNIVADLVRKDLAYGFRSAKNILRLMMASAVERGRERVSEEDYQRVKRLSYLFNEEYNQLKYSKEFEDEIGGRFEA